MKKQLIRVLFSCVSLLLVLSVFIFNSTHDQQQDSQNRTIATIDPKFVEIGPNINGRTPALDLLIDDPQAIEEIVRKLNLYDDTGFDHLSEIHPIFD